MAGGGAATTTGGVRCMAVAAEAASVKKTSSYQIMTLTTWLLKQEQSGIIDAELTIVLSSISMACKQIASLVQRASISNMTGVQGAVNIQGEDQKKLDVISNEVCYVTVTSTVLFRKSCLKLIPIHLDKNNIISRVNFCLNFN